MKIFRAQELERKATSEKLKGIHRRRVSTKELLHFVGEVQQLELELEQTREKLTAAEAALADARAALESRADQDRADLDRAALGGTAG